MMHFVNIFFWNLIFFFPLADFVVVVVMMSYFACYYTLCINLHELFPFFSLETYIFAYSKCFWSHLDFVSRKEGAKRNREGDKVWMTEGWKEGRTLGGRNDNNKWEEEGHRTGKEKEDE